MINFIIKKKQSVNFSLFVCLRGFRRRKINATAHSNKRKDERRKKKTLTRWGPTTSIIIVISASVIVSPIISSTSDAIVILSVIHVPTTGWWWWWSSVIVRAAISSTTTTTTTTSKSTTTSSTTTSTSVASSSLVGNILNSQDVAIQFSTIGRFLGLDGFINGAELYKGVIAFHVDPLQVSKKDKKHFPVTRSRRSRKVEHEQRFRWSHIPASIFFLSFDSAITLGHFGPEGRGNTRNRPVVMTNKMIMMMMIMLHVCCMVLLLAVNVVTFVPFFGCLVGMEKKREVQK